MVWGVDGDVGERVVPVSVETGDHSNEWLGKFAQTVSAMPEVMEFYRMAGDVDYMLRVVARDIDSGKAVSDKSTILTRF